MIRHGESIGDDCNVLPTYPAAMLGHGAVEGIMQQEEMFMDTQIEQSERASCGELAFLPKPLSELSPDHRAEWTGGISTETRLASGEMTQQDVEHIKSRVNDFYTATTPGAIVRCIDGRSGAAFSLHSADIMEKSYKFREAHAATKGSLIAADFPSFEELGPQIPGGTLAGGVSYRHAVSRVFGDFRNATIADDARTYGEKSSQGPHAFKAGDHMANPDKPGLGCGAVDGLEDIHNKVNPRNMNTIYGLTKSLLGSRFREDHFIHFASSAISLASNEGYFESKQQAIDYLEAHNPDALPELVGPHNEVIVVINTVPDTTLQRDYLNAVMREETGKDLQVFNYDVWYSEEMAEILFPDSEDMRELYLHCRVAKAVAALMYLTDGSQEIGVRTPVQIIEAVAA